MKILIEESMLRQWKEALESCGWNDDAFPDDAQYFDRFAVCEAATQLRTALNKAVRKETK